MATSRQRGWFGAALLAGLAYLLIGILFAIPAGHRSEWRLAAWIVSLAVFGAHFAYERVPPRHIPPRVALHVAVGVALGAFALAVAGMIHDLTTTSAIRRVWWLALVLWPVVAAVPAFVVALIAATMSTRLRPNPPEREE